MKKYNFTGRCSGCGGAILPHQELCGQCESGDNDIATYITDANGGVYNRCSAMNCTKAGTRSPYVKGDTYYCAEHFAEKFGS